MAAQIFSVPKDHILEEILSFGSELNAYTGDAAEFVFDFHGKGLDTPFGMLFLAFAIRKFIDAHPNCDHQAIHFEERWYASHMGISKLAGLRSANCPAKRTEATPICRSRSCPCRACRRKRGKRSATLVR